MARLEAAFPHSTCALDHNTPFQLLVATVLSAQTTDLAVNKATAELFARWPGPEELAQADTLEVGQVINGIGLWRAKAKNIVALSQMLVEEYDAAVPESVEDLTRLPGVGKKTATAVLGTAFGIAAGITVDTHMLRINRLLKLSHRTDADAMSRELERIIDPAHWSRYTHRIIDHGRLFCVANRPRCGVCPLADVCPSAKDLKAGYEPRRDEVVPASAKGLSWLARGLGALDDPAS